MSEFLLIYIWVVLLNMYKVTLFIGAIGSAIFGVMTASFHGEELEAEYLRAKRLWKISLCLLALGGVLFCVVPDKEELALIAGGGVLLHGGQYITESEAAKELPENVLRALNSMLEETSGD